MALRNLRFEGDEILRKKSRVVEKIDESIITLLDDMAETMVKCGNGVGLAAPQVGVLKRIVVIDVGEGLIELINPEIVKTTGEHILVEGCLSVPDVFGEIKRPVSVTVKALDRNGKEIFVEGSDLLAQALCHEIDHLNGVLFIDNVIKFIENK